SPADDFGHLQVGHEACARLRQRRVRADLAGHIEICAIVATAECKQGGERDDCGARQEKMSSHTGALRCARDREKARSKPVTTITRTVSAESVSPHGTTDVHP